MKFSDILEEIGATLYHPGHRHVTQNFIGIDCPFCGDSPGESHLGINTIYNFGSCWRCGFHSLPEVLQKLTGWPWGKVRDHLGGIDAPVREERPPGRLILPEGIGPLLPVHKQYLRARGLKPEKVEAQWGLKGIGFATKLAWRIWLPVTLHGRVVSWTTRRIGLGDDSGGRYESAPKECEAVPAKSCLFGADHARHAVIVVEGPFDAMRVGPGAVATLGTGWTRQQLLAASRFPVRCVCFDSDATAQERAKRLCSELSVFEGRTTLVVLDAKDPGSASKAEIKKLRKEFLE